MKRLSFILLAANLTVERIIDVYSSAIWTERYYESGDFELYMPATRELIDAVNVDFNSQSAKYICRADDLTKCGIIERVTITTDAENGNYLTVSGRKLDSLIFRRVVIQQTTYTGSPQAIIMQLLYNSFINPVDNDRKVANFEIQPATLSSDSFIITAQYDGANVGEEIEKLCYSYGIGYKITLDLENKKFIFSLYEGTDRTIDQNDVAPVIFSNDFNNLLSSSYTADSTNQKKCAVVAGEGFGTSRVKVLVKSPSSGLGLSEIFVNAQNTSANGGELTADAYEAALREEGQNALSEYRVVHEAEGEVAANYGFILNQDYFLGDLVTVKNEYGITMSPRVVEIIEADDETGYSCIPTFAQH